MWSLTLETVVWSSAGVVGCPERVRATALCASLLCPAGVDRVANLEAFWAAQKWQEVKSWEINQPTDGHLGEDVAPNL